ncbi:MAG: flagellar motor protein MotP [bacterium]|nr:MAG: flagellar motor protein MotP [bacterium]
MSTFLAILTGITLFFIAILNQGGFEVFINVPALMIVLGGTTAAVFISFPLPSVMRVSGVLLQIFKKDIQNPSWVIALMVRLSFKARQQSLLSLEQDITAINNRFIKLGLELVIDGHPAQLIREVLETELNFVQSRHRRGEHIFRTAGRFAPAFGLIGTLIGLVQMLQSLGSSTTGAASALGQGMAVALITTFYGAIMANLFFLPVSEKLKSRTNDEALRTQIIIEGVLMLQAGMNPRIIERKLNSYLPPEQRASYYEEILKRQRRS